jgi:alpha-tubulin suppressor-like RCC1 family protein
MQWLLPLHAHTENAGKRAPSASVAGVEDATELSAGSEYTCALLSTGGIKCWGYNGFGQLGAASTETFSAAPLAVTGINL